MRKLGVEHFTIVLIEYYSCNNKVQLLRHERDIFDLHNKNILLNINGPHTTCVEKRQQQVKYSSKWNIKNELHYKQYQKIYQHRYYQFNKLMQELPFYNLGFIFIGILLVAKNRSIENDGIKSVKFIRICVLICKNGAVNTLKANKTTLFLQIIFFLR